METNEALKEKKEREEYYNTALKEGKKEIVFRLLGRIPDIKTTDELIEIRKIIRIEMELPTEIIENRNYNKNEIIYRLWKRELEEILEE